MNFCVCWSFIVGSFFLYTDKHDLFEIKVKLELAASLKVQMANMVTKDLQPFILQILSPQKIVERALFYVDN